MYSGKVLNPVRAKKKKKKFVRVAWSAERHLTRDSAKAASSFNVLAFLRGQVTE